MAFVPVSLECILSNFKAWPRVKRPLVDAKVDGRWPGKINGGNINRLIVSITNFGFRTYSINGELKQLVIYSFNFRFCNIWNIFYSFWWNLVFSDAKTARSISSVDALRYSFNCSMFCDFFPYSFKYICLIIVFLWMKFKLRLLVNWEWLWRQVMHSV